MKLHRLAGMLNLLVAGALLLVGWVLVTLLGSRPALKHLFDLTPQARATVGPATRQLLQQLRADDKKVEFHLFFQPLYSPPQDEADKAEWDITSTLQTLTRDLLRQYAYLGGDAVAVKYYDLETDMQASRQAAQKYSVTATNTVVVVLGERHKKLSLHLDLGDIEMPALNPAAGPARRTLPTLRDYKGEEALTSAIQSLMVVGRPVLYFLSGYGPPRMGSTGGEYSGLVAALQKEGFDVRDLPLREKQAIPDDATVLALLEPEYDFNEIEADLLFGWLRRGGRLFIDYAYSPIPDHNPTGKFLGRRLGFELSANPVFQLVPSPNGTRIDGNEQVRNLTCHYNSKHPITGPLWIANRALGVQYGREFTYDQAVTGVRHEWIASSEPDAWIARAQLDATNMLRFDYRAPRVESAFAPRDVAAVFDVDGDTKERQGHAVLLAGYAFNNLMLSQNGDLALAIFNWLAERKVMVSVPGDRYHARHVKISLEQLDNIWWLLVVGVPSGFLLLGVLVYWRRSRWR